MNWLTEKREQVTKTKYRLTKYKYDLSGKEKCYENKWKWEIR